MSGVRGGGQRWGVSPAGKPEPRPLQGPESREPILKARAPPDVPMWGLGGQVPQKDASRRQMDSIPGGHLPPTGAHIGWDQPLPHPSTTMPGLWWSWGLRRVLRKQGNPRRASAWPSHPEPARPGGPGLLLSQPCSKAHPYTSPLGPFLGLASDSPSGSPSSALGPASVRD